jgi:hypothetical protein
MDHAGPRLEGRAQSLRHHLRKPAAGELSLKADDETAKTKPGYGNRGKTNYVFPPFPQPLLLLINYDEKAATKNNYDRLHKILDAAFSPNGFQVLES